MPSLTLSDRATVAFGDAGAGAPLVLVHGSPADGRAWGRVARHLAGFRILTPDLPGYGGSDPLRDGSGTPAMAGAVAAIIDAAGAPVWLAGHSYGGNVALHAALARRADVRGIVLFEPVFFRALALAGERKELALGRARGQPPAVAACPAAELPGERRIGLVVEMHEPRLPRVEQRRQPVDLQVAQVAAAERQAVQRRIVGGRRVGGRRAADQDALRDRQFDLEAPPRQRR